MFKRIVNFFKNFGNLPSNQPRRNFFQNAYDVVDGPPPEDGKVTHLSICFIVISLIFYALNIALDVRLLVEYYREGQLKWLHLTLIFLIFPAILLAACSVTMYFVTEGGAPSSWYRVFLSVIFLGLFVRIIDMFIYGCNTRKKVPKGEDDKNHNNINNIYNYKCMVEEGVKVSLLSLVQGMTESTSQLLLQMYILFTQRKVNKLHLVAIQIASILISFGSISWNLTSYNRALRRSKNEKNELTILSTIVMVVWKFLFIFPRLLAIALFTSIYGVNAICFIALHFVIMAIWYFFDGTAFKNEKKKHICVELLFVIAIAFVYCVDFDNINMGSSGQRYFLFYSISFIEILILSILWYTYPPAQVLYAQSSNFSLFQDVMNMNFLPNYDKLSNFSSSFKNNSSNFRYYYQMWPQNHRLMVIILCIIIFIIGVHVMILYYTYCHPSLVKKKQGLDKKEDGQEGINLREHEINITS